VSTVASTDEFERRLDAAERRGQSSTPRRAATFPAEALVWFALVPAWPLSVAEQSFPVGEGGLGQGDSVRELFERLEGAGIVESGPGESPLEGAWYWMGSQQRVNVLLHELPDRGLDSRALSLEQLSVAAGALADWQKVGNPLTPALERWITLVQPSGDPSANQNARRWFARRDESAFERTAAEEARVQLMAGVLDERVQTAMEAARTASSLACPDALRWIETAEPLAELLGGALVLALARAQRRLELFHRQARDERFLGSYYARPELEAAFKELVESTDDRAWALHYAGAGGVGKTMVLRWIKSRYALDHPVTTARVDFDHLNPEYPSRAPGLLLMGLAEELRLNDDLAVVKAFDDFDGAIRAVHGRQQGALLAREESDVTSRDATFDDALDLFVAALKHIAQTSRPVLILDTCEELSRLRADGTLPDNVAVTFNVLERIQKLVPSVRVVFSGRRPLAQAGTNWTWPGCGLPPRDYLQMCQVEGFTETEARGFLAACLKNRPLDSTLAEAILRQSSLDRTSQFRRRQIASPTRVVWTDDRPDETAAPHYNPFDLDLYASWVVSDVHLDADKLIAAGAHHYVKERILGRVSDKLSPWVPHLAVVGRFDRDFLEQLTDLPEPFFNGLFQWASGLEWLDIDRTAGPTQVWAVNPNMRERILECLRDESGPILAAAQAAVAALARKITLSRPWGELLVAYFEATLEAFHMAPAETAVWWNNVEARIARDAEWEWAVTLCDALLGPEGLAARLNPAITPPGIEEHPLRPCIRATEAAVRLHLRYGNPSPEIRSIWQEVVDGLTGRPDIPGREVALYRAHVGVAAHYEDLASASAQLASPAVERTLPGAQLVASELGLLENLVELWESQVGEPGNAPNLIGESILARLSILDAAAQAAAPDLEAFCLCLQARLFARLRDIAGSVALFEVAIRLPVPATPPQTWLDWVRPSDLAARLRLEMVRALAPAVDVEDLLALLRWVEAADAPESPKSPIPLDADRLQAATLLLESSLQPINRALPRASELPADEPVRRAHRAYPANFAVVTRLVADQGFVGAAVDTASSISGDTKARIDLRREAARVIVSIAIRMRLAERSVGLSTSLNNSGVIDDARQALRAQMLGPSFGQEASIRVFALSPVHSSYQDVAFALDDALALGRTVPVDRRFVQEWTRVQPREPVEEFTLLLRVAGPGEVPDALVNRIGRRRAAEIALEEGSLLSLETPGPANLVLRRALDWYVQTQDTSGAFLATIALALIAARTGDRATLTQLVDRLLSTQRPPVPNMTENWPSRAESPKLAETWIAFVEAAPDFWQPWLLRLAACAIRCAEYAVSGPQTDRLRTWLNVRYRGNWPLEMNGVLASVPEPRGTPVVVSPRPLTPQPDGPESISPESNAVPRSTGGPRSYLIPTLGVIELAAILVLLFFGFVWLLGKTVGDLGASADILAFGGTLIGAIAYVAGLVALARFGMTRFSSRGLELDLDGLPSPQLTFYKPFAVPYAARHISSLSGRVWWRARLERTHASEAGVDDPYSEQAADVWPEPSRLWRVIIGLSDVLWRGARGSFGIRCPDLADAAPWEAIVSLGQRHTRQLRDVHYAFQRVRGFPPPEVRVLRAPFVGRIEIVTVATDINSASLARSNWTPVLIGRTDFEHAWHQRIEPDESRAPGVRVGVLHIFGTPVETSAGLRLRVGGPTAEATVTASTATSDQSTEWQADEIAAAYRSVRVCIIHGLPLPPRARTSGDRRSAGIARRFGAELWRAGFPAVILLPPLPEPVAAEAIARLAKAVSRARTHAVRDLSRALRDIQDVVARLGHVDPEAAREMAFDVCFYAPGELNLTVVELEALEAPTTS
jgi:hypothetical protein